MPGIGATPNSIAALPKGENHWNWKGDNVSYDGVHYWVKRKLGKPSLCENCGKTEGNFAWSNISGKYLRALDDWARLCYSCHALIDGLGLYRRNKS